MRIAVLSDTHSRYGVIEAALQAIEPHRVHLLVHCGDLEDSEAIWLFPPNTHFVFGNCDHERAAMRQAIHGIGATLHEPFGQLEVAGARLAWTHGDDRKVLDHLENSGQFDYVFYGHTHVAAEHQTGRTRVINPGALHRVAKKTLLILDVATGDSQTVVIDA